MADDKPSDEDIRNMMRKTEEENSQGKISPKQSPEEKVSGGNRTEETISSQSSNREEPKGQPKKLLEETPDPREPGLHQRLSVLEAEISAIKDLVKAAVAQGDKVQAKNQGTQAKTKTAGKEETDQDKGQEELTTEEEMALLDKARKEKTKKEQGAAEEGPPSKDALVYLAAKSLDSATKTIVAFFQSKAAGTEEEDPFTKIAKAFVVKRLERDLTGEAIGKPADGTISLGTLKTVSDFQANSFASFFNAIGKLGKPVASKLIESALETGKTTEEIL